MKKNIIFLSLLLLGFASPVFKAQDFSENAKAEMAKNNFRPAIDELTVFLQSNPDNEVLLTYRSNFYNRVNESENAIADATKLLRINPKSTNGLIALASAKIAQGKMQEAIESLTQALAIQPNLKPALIFRSRAYFQLKQPEKALADLNFAIKDDPKNLEAYVYRGQLYTAMQKFEAAKADYQFILQNAVAGDKYHTAATQKMAEMGSAEAQAKSANTKKAEDDAYAKKITDQMTAVTKDMGEVTGRITKMLTNYTGEINQFIVRNDAIPKSNWQGKAELYEEIHPRITKYLADLKKERAKIAGNDLYKNIVTNIDESAAALELVIDRTSPYAVRRQQYVAEVNEYDAQITANFKSMQAAQKSSDRAEFERNKALCLSRTKNLLISVNEAREDLRKIDAAKYQKEDEAKFTTLLADYTRTMANINGINY